MFCSQNRCLSRTYFRSRTCLPATQHNLGLGVTHECILSSRGSIRKDQSLMENLWHLQDVVRGFCNVGGSS